ncbi:MAG: N-acetyltransferase [Deltaproteobacteria bacterium]|nr:N-acetyltransferase [Deltaproteobacteria bacterium]MBW2137644.1 N-acetyltransferase [Deltaproteobacteria bacterium]
MKRPHTETVKPPVEDLIDLPPEPPKKKGRKGKPLTAPVIPAKKNIFRIRKASVSDAENILELINGFAALNLMLPRGPQYVYENIRDFVVAVAPATADPGEKGRDSERVVACGSLHVLWEDIAEIRALAIRQECQSLGLGRKIFNHLKKEARALGIKRLFTFTMNEDFFKALGFKKIHRRDLPPKVWGECSRCPKYFQCDEVGMISDL